MTELVRVRYNPSLNGLPQLGSLRTACFNWLYARHYGGKMILRIDDLDPERRCPEALEEIIEGFKWLGIDWDEGPDVGGPFAPYIQSQRFEIYQRLAEKLVEFGYAYYCYCAPERLERLYAEQAANQESPHYDHNCRDMGLEVMRGALVRFKMPLTGTVAFHDLIRGDISFDNSTLDDFVLLKYDESITPCLANVIDDHMMGITQVIRSDESLPGTHQELMLYSVLGFTIPQFAHLPVVLSSDDGKYSITNQWLSLLDFRQQGYLPKAILNYLSSLGWPRDDKAEVLSREDLIRHFSIEKISKEPATINLDDLDRINRAGKNQFGGG